MFGPWNQKSNCLSAPQPARVGALPIVAALRSSAAAAVLMILDPLMAAVLLRESVSGLREREDHRNSYHLAYRPQKRG